MFHRQLQLLLPTPESRAVLLLIPMDLQHIDLLLLRLLLQPRLWTAQRLSVRPPRSISLQTSGAPTQHESVSVIDGPLKSGLQRLGASQSRHQRNLLLFHRLLIYRSNNTGQHLQRENVVIRGRSKTMSLRVLRLQV